MEYGLLLPQDISCIRKLIPCLLEDAHNELTTLFRTLLAELYDEMVHLDERIQKLEVKLKAICDQNEACQRLLSIPGVGLLSATAMVAAIGGVGAFKIVVSWQRG